MVKGETGMLSLDVRTSVDKGVSTSVFVSLSVFVKTATGTVTVAQRLDSSCADLLSFLIFFICR